MMPAGCEFICRNENCDYFNKGFTIVQHWPLGKIELVINSPNVKRNKPFRECLIKRKNTGQKYACINYPNENQIKIEGYRVEMWNDQEKRIERFDAIKQNEDENMDETINNKKIEIAGLRNFDDIVKNGIKCPNCKQKLTQERFFSNQLP